MLSSYYTLTLPAPAPVAARALKAATNPCVGDMPPVTPGEILPFGIDFSGKLSAGDVLVGASSAVSLYYGVDSNPADLGEADAYVVGSQVNQILGPGWLAGTIYTWTVTVDTALGAQFVNYAHITCIAPR